MFCQPLNKTAWKFVKACLDSKAFLAELGFRSEKKKKPENFTNPMTGLNGYLIKSSIGLGNGIGPLASGALECDYWHWTWASPLDNWQWATGNSSSNSLSQ